MEAINPNFSDKAKRDYYTIKQALDGNQKAFAELVDFYRDSLYFMLFKMVNNKIDAEDLTIETFGKAFKYLHLYTPNFAFSTWLFKIASNNCIDFLRKKKLKQKHIPIESTQDFDDSDPFYSVQTNTPDPEEKMIIQQKEILMRTIVKKLHPRYRKLIEMRYFEELSYQEIADELKIPIGTVKARLFRSRELLLNVLRDNNVSI